MISILSIDTSTKACSVALHSDGKLKAFRFLHEDKSHSVKLLGLIDEVMSESNLKLDQVDAFAISKGPGSYTGLRIGVSTVKGLCYALDKPLLSLGSLELMAIEVSKKIPESALICPMIDARRMEVYCALFNSTGNVIAKVEAKIIDESSFKEVFEKQEVYFCGDGSEKCKETFGNFSHAKFVDDIHPNAKWMGQRVYEKFLNEEFEDIAYFEPFYLKDFVATTPRKLL